MPDYGIDNPIENTFDLVLEAAGDKKIQVAKEVREFTRLGRGGRHSAFLDSY